MYNNIIFSKTFDKNYSKIEKSGNKKVFNALVKTVNNLINGIINPNDHKLKGKLAKYRACHYDFSEKNEEVNEKSKNKWVVVYKIENENTLYLKATGTHNVYDTRNEFYDD